jgi:hypothetical protein
MKRKVLNPNCSEQVFRLAGSLEEIKEQVINMVKLVREERREEGYLKTEEDKKIYKDKIKEIKAIKTLDEFIDLFFDFTCNYETFFKPNGSDLLVATCNNHTWSDSVDYIEDSREYYDVANHRYFQIVAKEKDWILIKQDIYSNGNYTYYALETKDVKDIAKFEFNKYNPDDIQLRKLKGKFLYYYEGKKYIFTEIKDKEKRKKVLDIGMIVEL